MNLLKKIIYPVNFKRVILALIFVITAIVTTGAVYDVALKNVTLNNIDEFNGVDTSVQISTRKTTVGEFLEENDIVLSENDNINKSVDEEIFDNDVLIIRKGRVIELTADGNVEYFTVTKAKVGEALAEAGVVVNEDDVVSPDVDSEVTEMLSVNIDRFVTEYKVVNEVIEFDTERVEDNTLEVGKTKVIESGKNGEKEVKYSLLKKNGEEISKDVVSETIIKKPVTRVVHVGTKKKAKTESASKKNNASSSSKKNSTAASSGKEFAYSKKIEVVATAYSKNLKENGGNSKTAYGLVPNRGIVAVDPKVIPLGTKLYIESSDGGKSWVYGYCIAGDTGGAIKGNKVDLCFDTEGECVKFGRRNATVYILK